MKIHTTLGILLAAALLGAPAAAQYVTLAYESFDYPTGTLDVRGLYHWYPGQR